MSSEADRSGFVTALAWVFIAITGFTTFISLAQNLMIGFLFGSFHLNDIPTASGAEDIPAFVRFMLSNLRVFFLLFLAASAILLASAIGLLKRMNWGRIIFMLMMGLGIAWIVFAVIIQFTVFPQMMHDIPDALEDEGFRTMFAMMRAFTLVFAAAFCILFGWIIKKLSARDIKDEFTA